MLIPCANSENDCFPCQGDSSNPQANISVEPFDLNIWLSVYFGSVANPPPNIWRTLSCIGFCESATSQLDADDCAKRLAFECLNPPFLPPAGPVTPPVQMFCNESMVMEADGQCYTIDECTVNSFSRLEANAIARSLGDFRVHDPTLTSPCAITPPIIPPVIPPVDTCPVESGSPAPDTLEVIVERDWETFEVAPASLTEFISTDISSNPTGRWYLVWPNMHDHPPGEYQVEYVSGFFVENPNPCGGADTGTIVHIYQLWDDEHSMDAPTPGANQAVLANQFRTVEPGPPTGNFGSGFSACYPTFAASQAFFSTLYNTPGAKKRFAWNYINSRTHSNDGGDFRYVLRDIILATGVPVDDLLTEAGYEFRLKIVQIDGLVPQPRAVAIDDYASLIAEFSDPVAASAWNGELNTRAVYTDVALNWTAPASGQFGGAVLSWINNHPTSANGFGWELSIYSAGAVLIWRGFRGVGNDPLGRFYKYSASTPIGPNCVTCSDISPRPWEP